MEPHLIIAAIGRAFDCAARHDARTWESLETLLQTEIAPRLRQGSFDVRADPVGTITITTPTHSVRLTLEVEPAQGAS